ncbi:MAG: hypothetical protein V4447_10470 [Pseudomonadota bacterium]
MDYMRKDFVITMKDDEVKVLDGLCKEKQLTRSKLLLQALRLYQAVEMGNITIQYRKDKPFLLDK